ncbi:hypothetical protein [Pedobacter caeni]|uniref:DUF4259 domain-containing protein n=1 Tax=Pedobacter caeni TaxID=288992 RepID=A0A1M4UD94_9SPHI|nr:hypothetical protein [Pedobacter caeni]SHE54543.1 hypothetical protein SAMN04488522_101511 [Pedobacter caeni]
MGAWGTGILDNDSAMDLYGFFEKLYDKQILDIESIKQKTIAQFGLLNENNEPVYGAEEWLAYALICWECKALDESTIGVVKEIINDREEIEDDWEDLAEKRIGEMEKFLVKIQTPAKRKKTVRKSFVVDVPFQPGDCIVVACEDGMFSGLILLDIDKKHADEPNMWSYFFGTTRIYSENPPTLEEMINSHFLVVNYGETFEGKDASWIKDPKLWVRGAFIGSVKNEKEKQAAEDRMKNIRIIGNVKLDSKPIYKLSYGGFRLDDRYQLKSQTEWEKKHKESMDLSYPVKKYIANDPGTNKNSWKFWK